jgi:uncharacterized protein
MPPYQAGINAPRASMAFDAGKTPAARWLGNIALNEASKSQKAGPKGALAKDWIVVADFLREHPNLIREDADLLAELGLWIKADNVVEFGPAALAHLSAAQTREKVARRQLEATARINFAAQAQTHAAVIDLLEARNQSDLARRVDEIARTRFGLVAGVIALEVPETVPAGWRPLPPEGVDGLLGYGKLSRMGEPGAAQALFGAEGVNVASVALVRIGLWTPVRQGLLAFGSSDEDGFTHDMGAELVALLAQVVERTAERWPVL